MCNDLLCHRLFAYCCRSVCQLLLVIWTVGLFTHGEASGKTSVGLLQAHPSLACLPLLKGDSHSHPYNIFFMYKGSECTPL